MAPGKKKGKNVVSDSSCSSSSSSSDLPAPILQDIPAPIATCDLTDPTEIARNYKKCVEAIIQEMKKGTDKEFTFFKDDKEICSVPVTPALDQSPNGPYVIELKHGDKRLLLVGDKYQTWFRGIVTNSGKRYEIDKMIPKIMSMSGSLVTDSRYSNLLQKTVAWCKVGYFSLLRAMHRLAGQDLQEDSEYKVCIAVIIVMFFEAPRFPPVFELCMSQLEKMTDSLVGMENENLIGDWFDNSKDFYDAHGEEKKVTLTDQSPSAIKRVETSIRLLCRSAWDKWLAKESP